MNKTLLVKRFVILFIVSLLCTTIIIFFPNIFSPEDFATRFSPIGGIVHELVGTFVISLIIPVIYIFSQKYSFKTLFLVIIMTSILISVYQYSRLIFQRGIIHTPDSDMFSFTEIMQDFGINPLVYIIYFGLEVINFVYYTIILSLPLAITSLLKVLFLKVKEKSQ